MLKTDTALGKTVKTLVWVGVSAALVAVLTTVTNRPEMFNPSMVVLANTLLVLVKNLADPRVKNL